jgi:hypothetical protein
MRGTYDCVTSAAKLREVQRSKESRWLMSSVTHCARAMSVNR